MNKHSTIGFGLTLVMIIWAIIAGNTASIPNWTIAIPAVIVGFWWAFGRGVVGDGSFVKDEHRTSGRAADDAPH